MTLRASASDVKGEGSAEWRKRLVVTERPVVVPWWPKHMQPAAWADPDYVDSLSREQLAEIGEVLGFELADEEPKP